jgi:hypothetical protein
MVAPPIGSLSVTLWLSQAKDVGWWWNSQSEFEIAAQYASGGILFYTASFAALETGAWLVMVLALQAIKRFEEEREKRQQNLIALGAEAERQRQETGESLDEAIKRLQTEGWKPSQP